MCVVGGGQGQHPVCLYHVWLPVVHKWVRAQGTVFACKGSPRPSSGEKGQEKPRGQAIGVGEGMYQARDTHPASRHRRQDREGWSQARLRAGVGPGAWVD